MCWKPAWLSSWQIQDPKKNQNYVKCTHLQHRYEIFALIDPKRNKVFKEGTGNFSTYLIPSILISWGRFKLQTLMANVGYSPFASLSNSAIKKIFIVNSYSGSTMLLLHACIIVGKAALKGLSIKDYWQSQLYLYACNFN